MFGFLSEKFSGVLGWLKGKTRLTEQNISTALEQVEEALLEADVPLDVVRSFLASIKEEVVGKKITTKLNPGENLIKIVHQKLLEFLGASKSDESFSFQIPSVIMVMGLQGSGKTTTIAKLAQWVINQAKKKGKERRILLASVDFYRPAAVEQLKVLADKVDVSFYKAQSEDSLKAAQEIYAYFKNNSFEYLFLDTAGRLHIDEKLMAELQSINTKIKPRYKILVLDSMTGQESLNVAQTFEKRVGFQSAIMTKMDSDARGGAVFAFRYSVKKPIYFVGVGEKVDDFERFIPERMAKRILGMGDILTLIEKADDTIESDKQESMTRRLMSGKITLVDFAEQMNMANKIGSLGKIASYLPGKPNITPEMLEKGEMQMKQFKAVISSMTLKERLMPSILDASRRKRIASGSGTSVQVVNQLIEKFEQSRQFAKMFKKVGKFGPFSR